MGKSYDFLSAYIQSSLLLQRPGIRVLGGHVTFATLL